MRPTLHAAQATAHRISELKGFIPSFSLRALHATGKGTRADQGIEL